MTAATTAPSAPTDARIALRGLTVEVSRVSRASTWKQKLLRQAPKANDAMRVLDGIDLEIGAGEVVGLVGRNGAGKSSLLKAICGIYPASGGERVVRGRIAPVIASAIGFDYELAVRDNIALTFAYLGRFDEFDPAVASRVVDFAELSGHESVPLKKLSSGQQARLAYSIVLAIDAEILVLDEVLTTGDLSFVRKGMAAMQAKIARTPIVLFVSHELDRVRTMCTRCVWLVGGRIVADGAPGPVIDAYEAAAAGQA